MGCERSLPDRVRHAEYRITLSQITTSAHGAARVVLPLHVGTVARVPHRSALTRPAAHQASPWMMVHDAS